MHKQFGVVPALVTPLDEQGRVLEKPLRQLIDYTISGGVHGVFVLGSTGEFYGLEWEQKKRAIEITVDQTNGRVPVYVGASEITTRGCQRLVAMAEDYGVAAVSVLTPYFITPNEDELIEHYRAIARSSKLPIILYGNDDRTNVSISPEAVRKLSFVDNIVGIKDSSGDMTKMGEYIRRTQDREFSVIAGRDTMILANLAYGGSGAIAATANIVPALATEIFNAYVSGNHARALQCQFDLAPLRLAFSLGSFPVVMKEALNLVGIDAGVAVLPIGPLSPEKRAQLAEVLEGLGVLGLLH